MKENDVYESGFLNEFEENFDDRNGITDVEILNISEIYVIARGRRYGRWWLLKALSEKYRNIPEERCRLQKEFEIHSRLLGLRVSQSVGIENIDGLGLCIVEEWVEGKALSVLLQEGGLRKSERRRIMREIVKAVGFIHSKGVVHGNLNLSNVMVRNVGGGVVLVNFGSASSAGSPSSDAYAADIYGLGMIMKELTPEYEKIAGRCTGPAENRPADTAELIKSLDSHDCIPKRICTVAVVAFLIVSGVVSAVYINKLNDATLEAQEKVISLGEMCRLRQYRVEELKDSLLALNVKMREVEEEMSNRDFGAGSRKGAYLAACRKIDRYIGSFEKNVMPLFNVPAPAFYDSINALHDKLQNVCNTAYNLRLFPELERDDEGELYIEVENHYLTAYSAAFTGWQAWMYANSVREKRKISSWPPKEVLNEIYYEKGEQLEKQ